MTGHFEKGKWINELIPTGIRFIPSNPIVLSSNDTLSLVFEITTDKAGVITSASGKCGKNNKTDIDMDIELITNRNKE